MKSESPSPPKPVAGRKNSRAGMSHLPMEWMDPMSWRLPSGMALAEFALQTGFLAPLMMRAPNAKRQPQAVDAASKGTASKEIDRAGLNSRRTQERVEGAPGRKASFWQTR
jgi:hypothetical protein